MGNKTIVNSRNMNLNDFDRMDPEVNATLVTITDARVAGFIGDNQSEQHIEDE